MSIFQKVAIKKQQHEQPLQIQLSATVIYYTKLELEHLEFDLTADTNSNV
jgi:hypothetical protein